MSKVWLKNNRVILQDGKVTLCNDCPCEPKLCANEIWYDGENIGGDGSQLNPFGTVSELVNYWINNTSANTACNCLLVNIIGSVTFNQSDFQNASLIHGGVMLLKGELSNRSVFMQDIEYGMDSLPFNFYFYLENFNILQSVANVYYSKFCGLVNVTQDFTNCGEYLSLSLIRSVSGIPNNCLGDMSRCENYNFINPVYLNFIEISAQEIIDVIVPPAYDVYIGGQNMVTDIKALYFRIIKNITISPFYRANGYNTYMFGSLRFGAMFIENIIFPSIQTSRSDPSISLYAFQVSNVNLNTIITDLDRYKSIRLFPLFDFYPSSDIDVLVENVLNNYSSEDEAYFVRGNGSAAYANVNFHVSNSSFVDVNLGSSSTGIYVYASNSSYVTINMPDHWIDV